MRTGRAGYDGPVSTAVDPESPQVSQSFGSRDYVWPAAKCTDDAAGAMVASRRAPVTALRSPTPRLIRRLMSRHIAGGGTFSRVSTWTLANRLR